MKAFKIVTIDLIEGLIRPYTYGGTRTGITFIRDGWNYPLEGDGPFSLFDNIESAMKLFRKDRQFAKFFEPLIDSRIYPVIYKCEYKPSYHEFLYSNKKVTHFKRSGFPRGTIFASTFKLLEPLWKLDYGCLKIIRVEGRISIEKIPEDGC